MINFGKKIEVFIDGERQGDSLSDGYHTMDDLYEHRAALYIALCSTVSRAVWRSKKHSDGSSFDGWFILGINKAKGRQITYHLPMAKWPVTDFAETLAFAPVYDHHSSDDVLHRIKRLLTQTPEKEKK